MKKYAQVFLMLSLPATTLWLLFQGVVSFIVNHTTDYSLIGQKISESVPYILMVNHSIAFLILLLVLRFHKIELTKIVSRFNGADLTLGLVVGLILFAFQQLVLLPILTQLDLFEFRGGFPGYAYFVSATVFAAIVEEFIYRGYGMTMLRDLGVHRFFNLAMTTLFFCLLHYGQGWAGIINAAFLGLGLAMWYLKRANLYSNIVAHAVFNFMVLLTITLRS